MHVCIARAALPLYVSERTRKRVKREKRKQAKGRTVDGREERGNRERERERETRCKREPCREPQEGGGGVRKSMRKADDRKEGESGNRGESEGDGKLCEIRSSAHKPSYITEPHPLSCRTLPRPSLSVSLTPEMKPNFSLLPQLTLPRHPLVSLSPPFPSPLQPPRSPAPCPSIPSSRRLSSPYPIPESKGVLWG